MDIQESLMDELMFLEKLELKGACSLSNLWNMAWAYMIWKEEFHKEEEEGVIGVPYILDCHKNITII